MDRFSMFRCFSDVATESKYYTAGEERNIVGTLTETARKFNSCTIKELLKKRKKAKMKFSSY